MSSDLTPSQLPPIPPYGEYAAGQQGQQQQQPQPLQQPQPQPQPQPGGPYQAHPPAYYAPQPQQQYGLQPYAAQYNQGPYGTQHYPAPYGAKRPIRTADAIISIVLLVLALIGTAIAFGMAAGLDSFMQGGYDSAGLGTYEQTDAYRATQAFIIASHLVLLAISTPVTIMLIVKRKISFWLPLAAGVLAAIVFWLTLMVFMYSDPSMAEWIMNP